MLHSRPSWTEMPVLHKGGYSQHPLRAVSAIQLGHYSQQLNLETQVSSAVPGARRLTKHSSGCPARPGWVRTNAPCEAFFEVQVSDLCATDLTQANQSRCFMAGFILQLTRLQSSPPGSSESVTESKAIKTSCTLLPGCWGEKKY